MINRQQITDTFADKEHVEVCSKLLENITNQILTNTEIEGIDEVTSHAHAQAALIEMFANVAESQGYTMLRNDLNEMISHYH